MEQVLGLKVRTRLAMGCLCPGICFLLMHTLKDSLSCWVPVAHWEIGSECPPPGFGACRERIRLPLVFHEGRAWCRARPTGGRGSALELFLLCAGCAFLLSPSPLILPHNHLGAHHPV